MSGYYLPDPGTYQMSETVQFTTLAIAAAVLLAALVGFKALWDDWAATWSREDAEAAIDGLADDYFAGRDQHASVPMVSERWVG